MTEAATKKKVCILGGGNAAHVFSVMGSKDNVNDVVVCSLYADEAERWTKNMSTQPKGMEVFLQQSNTSVFGKPSLVTKDIATALKGSDIIVLSIPAFAHKQYLTEIYNNRANLKEGTVIGVFPGAGGFESEYLSVMKEARDQFIVSSCETLPWACRIASDSEGKMLYGQKAEVIGTKNSVNMGSRGTKELMAKINHLQELNNIIGDLPKLIDAGHLLASSIGATNGILHPSILYGLWKDWDGKPVKEKPLFYHGISQEAADFLSATSDECLAIAEGVRKAMPDLKLVVPHIYDWYVSCYGKECSDTSTLYNIIRTNPGYNGLTHPMAALDDGTFVPNWKYRYLTEDIPQGVAVFKGLGLLVSVPTPKLDELLYWAQEKMGKEFFTKTGEVGKDIQMTRAPQKYGFNKIEDLR